jgi:hypothetical protein
VRLTPRQVDSALGKLIDAGIVIKAVYKFGRNPTTHVRIDEAVFLERLTVVVTVDRNRYYKSVKSPIRDNQEITDPLKPRKSPKAQEPKPTTTITKTTNTKTTVAASIDAPPKIPAKEFQTAFIAGLGYTDAAYKDGKFLTQVKNLSQAMFDCSLTPADVPSFIAFCRTQFRNKQLTPALIRDMVLPFDASRAARPQPQRADEPTGDFVPSTIDPDTRVVGGLTAAEFDALPPEEKLKLIDRITNLTGRMKDAEGDRRDRHAARAEFDALIESA